MRLYHTFAHGGEFYSRDVSHFKKLSLHYVPWLGLQLKLWRPELSGASLTVCCNGPASNLLEAETCFRGTLVSHQQIKESGN